MIKKSFENVNINHFILFFMKNDNITFQKVRTQGKAKIVCIPTKSNINPGDYVQIVKINLEESN